MAREAMGIPFLPIHPILAYFPNNWRRYREQVTTGCAANGPGGVGEQHDERAAASCRLIYVDPATMELKGEIPWSRELHAELLPRGQFRIYTPLRTYYLEDAAGDEAVAELWVQTICDLQARTVVESSHLS